MFSLTASSRDYSCAYKGNLIHYLKSHHGKEISQNNQDFKDLFEMMNVAEQLITEMNAKFNQLEEKYKLVFGLRDFETLLKQKDFKDEILLYVKYKGNEQQ